MASLQSALEREAYEQNQRTPVGCRVRVNKGSAANPRYEETVVEVPGAYISPAGFVLVKVPGDSIRSSHIEPLDAAPLSATRKPDEMDPLESAAFTGLKAAIFLAHQTANNAGWYTNPKTGEPVRRNFGEVTALMHSELSEALEADRKNSMDDKLKDRPGQEVEFADAFIRIGDTSSARNENIPAAFIAVARLLKDHSITEIRFALALFRLCEASGDFGFDLAGAIIAKNQFNVNRPDHKLENRATAGGKAY